ncbi:RDD family protein [Prosthecobacter sp. SYSU 5D2]|uniref:RDD family protein n=1 Tax=Prosthecobacter sp. SYSU 5D2 TaxID=3134134 RepID=UPI0031FE7677
MPTPMPTGAPAAMEAAVDPALASIWIRLASHIIDMIAAIICVVILQFITGALPPIVFSLLFAAVLVGINWTFLQQGQTLGKKLLNLKIVRRDGRPADRMHIITKRLLPVWLVGAIPYLGALVLLADALCIFRPGRNTLHDDLAETKVIQL